MGKYNKKRSDIFLVRMKRLTVFAIISSILLTLFLLYESSLAGDESSDHSSVVSDSIKDNFDIDDTKKPQSIKFDEDKISKTYCFAGEAVYLPMTFEPAGCDTTVEYTFSHQGCSVTDGYLTYTGTNLTTVTVTATSIYDSSVSASVDVIYRGINPMDDGVESVNLYIAEPSSLNEKKNYSVEKDAVNNCDISELSIGKSYFIKLTLTLNDLGKSKYGIEEDEISARGIPFSLVADGANIQLDAVDRMIMFYEEYSGEITLNLRKSSTSTFSDVYGAGDKTSVSAQINVDTSYDYVPSSPLIPSLGEKIGDTYVITCPPDTEYIDIGSESQGGTVNTMGKIIFANEESQATAKITGRGKLTKTVNGGTCELYLVSLFNNDESLRTKITVIFEEAVPTQINVIGNRDLSVGKSETFKVETAENLYEKSEVRFTVVEGENVISLDGSTVTALKNGNAVIRAESVHYPGVYTDITIKVRPWDNFSGLIRKVVGHFLAFFFLGQGYIVCWFFLIKKRWPAFILAPLSLYGVAMLTEEIQKNTANRHGNMDDVIMDFRGGLFGMASVIAVVIIYLIILRCCNRGGFERLKHDLPKMGLSTVFTHLIEPDDDYGDVSLKLDKDTARPDPLPNYRARFNLNIKSKKSDPSKSNKESDQ